jgi:hypothetical protein
MRPHASAIAREVLVTSHVWHRRQVFFQRCTRASCDEGFAQDFPVFSLGRAAMLGRPALQSIHKVVEETII